MLGLSIFYSGKGVFEDNATKRIFFVISFNLKIEGVSNVSNKDYGGPERGQTCRSEKRAV